MARALAVSAEEKVFTAREVEMAERKKAIDLIADQLVIDAVTGIGPLQTSVNTLTAATVKGSVHIEDNDSYGELGLGLNVISVTAPEGNVTIQGNRSVDVINVVAGGFDGTVRLTSLTGNLTLIQPASGDVITYNRGVAFSAGQTLSIYRFFYAPDLMEYRGDEIVIAGVTDRLGIPSVLEGDTIILEQRNGIRLKDQTSLKAEHLELLTDRNLAIQNAGTISAGELVMRALGYGVCCGHGLQPSQWRYTDRHPEHRQHSHRSGLIQRGFLGRPRFAKYHI